MASYEKMISDLGKSAMDFAKEFAKGNYARSIFPGKNELKQELDQTIANNAKIYNSLLNDKVQNAAKSVLQSDRTANISEDDIKHIASRIHAGTYEKDLEKLKGDIAKHSKNADMIIDDIKNEAKSIMGEGVSPDAIKTMNPGVKAMKYTQAYFSNPDKKITQNRIATAAAAYVGVSVGGRYLSGGNLTSDSYGKKDIAGIPFI